MSSSSEERQRLNLRVIGTSFRAALASTPPQAEERLVERSLELLGRAEGSATTDEIRAEIDELRSEIAEGGGERTG